MREKNQKSTIVSLFIFLISIDNGISLDRVPNKHFVLIHGACHGAWSWYKLIALLNSSGHNVTAIDLAASGIDLRQVNDLRSISDYHRPLMELMESLPENEKVILVGHSLGGLAISQAMERFPHKISVAVFVTALMPGPSLNISTLNNESFSRQGSLLDSHYIYGDGPKNPPTAFIFGPLFLSSIIYKLSPIEDWALATTLQRPLPLFSEEDQSKEIVVTSENYGSVYRVFAIAEKDEVSEKSFQKWMIERNPPNEVIQILGSDHMVMTSKPALLCSHLLNIAIEC
ncbi:salicylic acid-binding protein 2-like [Jatropha curcas]|uniref:salicylic acid-binding protein 2-like n=1 Tax=Jatropha curcas TaxID=180498 RepID=UPI0005FC028A|nr:salicylic acid-binding protein 2-like [Jatropha curcas]